MNWIIGWGNRWVSLVGLGNGGDSSLGYSDQDIYCLWDTPTPLIVPAILFTWCHQTSLFHMKYTVGSKVQKKLGIQITSEFVILV